jgi:sugar phosphate isomerase/epimerase
LESLGLPFRKALSKAERLGVSGVQWDAVGELSPDALSQTARREIRHLLRSHNVELTALGCPLRRGLDAAENQQPRIEHIGKVLSLSFDLGPRRAIVQAGRVPSDSETPAARLQYEAVLALSQLGDRVGAVLALETGLESGEDLAAFLDRFDSGSLGANVDPANWVMHGFDPLAGAAALAGRIVHAHAKDARASTANRSAQEVALGHGDIDWMGFLGALEAADYRGWLVVERESGADRLRDVTNGVAFLRRVGVG